MRAKRINRYTVLRVSTISVLLGLPILAAHAEWREGKSHATGRNLQPSPFSNPSNCLTKEYRPEL